MDDLSNRKAAQEAGEELSPDQRAALKQCLDDMVALIDARLFEGARAAAGHEAPTPSD